MIDGLTVRVAAKHDEAADICSFELVRADGLPLPPFSAGSHIDVIVPGGPTRQYSLCNAPDENHRYRIAVLRDPKSRGGSAGMHDRVNAGDTLTISAPRNHFALAPGATHSLLLAGGIGVTPILCMAERLARIDASFDMHYCTRSRPRTAFLDRIARAPYAGRVQVHFDDEADSQRFDIAARLAVPEPGTHLYVCGPKGFMDAVLTTARASGWPEAQLHYEFFAADERQKDQDGRFEVEIASSGRVIVVEKNESVVQALAKAGIEIETSCEQGVCGTCATRVLAGEPEHFDLCLTPDERAANDQFLPCCSRSKTARLVLDL
ncbi:Vanillate O-demethylase oxidoreductase [Burkholderia stabilis]|uniref:PDR/VanB family oxidoreductase n=1 Tax=Burkholderia stabilis TaxID=95485 RepID=UPI0008520AF6|nr:PDR/VanB family oxidoreductase [Burkholderia stabilis]AOR73257.1 Vanillate O-demethylase oxidoreductase [Burkholderia stabilis]HDR9494307.1 oxidoreductase [Burkholderia stabilis]HDR9541275.1 oxidoreductase [Burkholderia stabilis]HDR9570879.1 oxidoreductase [Burkholderia stabilis]HDR9579157.1 oxidoreductase [Burkholderia stabilis]